MFKFKTYALLLILALASVVVIAGGTVHGV